MTAGAKVKGEIRMIDVVWGRGGPGDRGRTNPKGRHVSGFDNVIRRSVISFQELILLPRSDNVAGTPL